MLEKWSADWSGEASQGFGKRHRPSKTAVSRCRNGQGDPQGARVEKLLTLANWCKAGDDAREVLRRDRVSKRRACRVLDQPRSTQLRTEHVPSDEPQLVKRIIKLASEYWRHGYRRKTALLRKEGWQVNHKPIVENRFGFAFAVTTRQLGNKSIERKASPPLKAPSSTVVCGTILNWASHFGLKKE